jgi:hypothetical protein
MPRADVVMVRDAGEPYSLIAGLCVAAVGLVDGASAHKLLSASVAMRPRRAQMDDWLRSGGRSRPTRGPVEHTTMENR